MKRRGQGRWSWRGSAAIGGDDAQAEAQGAGRRPKTRKPETQAEGPKGMLREKLLLLREFCELDWEA